SISKYRPATLAIPRTNEAATCAQQFAVSIAGGRKYRSSADDYALGKKTKGTPCKQGVPDVNRLGNQCLGGQHTLGGDYDQLDRSFDVAVQVQSNFEFASVADGTVGQAHFSLADRHTSGGQGISDVMSTDGTEQLALIAGDGGDGDFQLIELGSTGFGSRLLLGSSLFQLGAACFESSNVGRGGSSSLALRQQVVTAVASLDIYLVAQVAQVGDFFQQDDFHLGLTS